LVIKVAIEELPVVVIGAGPVGLAAAAELAERGIEFLVIESGPTVGAAITEWAHVKLFSPWRYNVAPAAKRLLEADGWTSPALNRLPTGGDLVDSYLAPLAKLPALASAIRYDATVVAIARDGIDRVRTAGREQAPFVLRLADGTEMAARAVIDASGTWRTPNVLGANALAAPGEADAADNIDSALPDVLGADRDRYAGRHTPVIGAGHSAANTLLALAQLARDEPGTTVSWAIRTGSPSRTYGGGEADALPARGALGSRVHDAVDAGRISLHPGFSVARIQTADGRVSVSARSGETLTVDRIVSATGFRPDHSIASELRLDLDPTLESTRALAPLIDPNEHSCGTVPPHGVDELGHPEAGYYAVGAKSYGRAPTFLMATGYEQVRSVVAAITGKWAAARDVQLDLPEIGVCSSSTTLGDDNGSWGGTPAAAPTQGLATGISGGLLTLPVLDAQIAEQSGCCSG
jgi:hypothetical protein